MTWENRIYKPEPAIRLVQQQADGPCLARIPTRRSCRWWPLWENLEENALAVQVFLTQRAYVRLCAYASLDLEHEVGGWMVGRWCRDRASGAEFVVVETILPAQHTQQGSAFLTFTQESQLALHETLNTHYPEKRLVGWYHTHPHMGVFFSSMDTWLHENFFPEPWQVALVIEPVSVTGGFFIRQVDGTLDPRRYFGFYEITNRKKRSVVHWKNMMPDLENPVWDGG